MFREGIYKATLFICIMTLGILGVESFKSFQSLHKKQVQLNILKEKEKNKQDLSKKFGYSDIIKTLDKKDTLKITRFSEQKEKNTATVEAKIMQDINNTQQILKDIRNRENFSEFNDIKVEKYNSDNIITTVNMDFVKNK